MRIDSHTSISDPNVMPSWDLFVLPSATPSALVPQASGVGAVPDKERINNFRMATDAIGQLLESGRDT